MRPGTSYLAPRWQTRIAVFATMAFAACGSSGDNSGGGAHDGGTSSSGADGAPAVLAVPDDGAADTGSETVDARTGSSDAEAGIGATGDVAAACAAYAHGYCGRFAACSAIDFGIDYGTTAVCEQRISQLLCPAQFDAPGTAMSSAALMQCASAITSQSCGEWMASAPSPCTMSGALGNGVGCEFDAQCTSGFCAVARGSWCGVCRATIAVGQPCDPDSPACDPGLLCADTGCTTPPQQGVCTGTRQWFCVSPVMQGGDCVTPAQCSPELTCAGGLCSPPQGLGQPCQPGLSCNAKKSLYCVANAEAGGFACATAQFVDPGVACDTLDAVLCASSGICRAVADGSAANVGTCFAPAADGASCGRNPCLAPARCVQGTCQGPVAASSCH